ncbi:hypothetical protein EYZ11_004477 [Aspergillus tanneri]|uniref:Cytochrome P450 monooxygenase n=1 Tax=Aspergillus tanneri TaxID=1220188 RepID=A0A4S3JKJ0_9EURO|nr:hypothetical protein EYZ11_004477 [Aspergillus tanneri]
MSLDLGSNAVSLSDGDALHSVYVAGGGLPKDSRYRNFRVEGHDTIFSTLDPSYRNIRAKAVLPLFATSRIHSSYEDNGMMSQLVNKFVDILRTEKDRASPRQSHKTVTKKVDILDLSSRLSIDVLTGYLFKKVYGGLDEQSSAPAEAGSTEKRQHPWGNKLSATPFVLAIVAFSRFSLLPSWLFTLIISFQVGLTFRKETAASLEHIANFVAGIMDVGTGTDTGTRPDDNETYQSRLLAAGISHSETLIQCKAAMFAGADSTAVMLSTILFHLVQRPDVRQRVKEEIDQRPAGVDYRTLPYLRAVIREGLRLGMANPVRLTRIVPPESQGLSVSGFYLPPGTVVGAAAYVFHHNPDIFPMPFEFQPERWISEHHEEQHNTQARRLMDRDFFPFGLGSRACLGRNLAMQQLFAAVSTVVESGVLEGAKTCTRHIELIEWFNAEIKGHELEIEW